MHCWPYIYIYIVQKLDDFSRQMDRINCSTVEKRILYSQELVSILTIMSCIIIEASNCITCRN